MKLLSLPHKYCESTCYVNGLEDILAWKGAEFTNYLLSLVGGMAGFAYLRFKRADPPCMVYWGSSPKYLLKDLGVIIGFEETVIEGKIFKNTFHKLKEFIDTYVKEVNHNVCYIICKRYSHYLYHRGPDVHPQHGRQRRCYTDNDDGSRESSLPGRPVSRFCPLSEASDSH